MKLYTIQQFIDFLFAGVWFGCAVGFAFLGDDFVSILCILLFVAQVRAGLDAKTIRFLRSVV